MLDGGAGQSTQSQAEKSPMASSLSFNDFSMHVMTDEEYRVQEHEGAWVVLSCRVSEACWAGRHFLSFCLWAAFFVVVLMSSRVGCIE